MTDEVVLPNGDDEIGPHQKTKIGRKAGLFSSIKLTGDYVVSETIDLKRGKDGQRPIAKSSSGFLIVILNEKRKEE